MKRFAFTLMVVVIAAGCSFAQKSEAQAAENASRWDDAAQLYQKVVEKDASDGEAWYGLANARFQTKDYAGAAQGFEKSAALKFRPMFSIYNAACAYARAGDSEKALAALEILQQRGAYALVRNIKQDDDLAPLRSSPRYQQVVAEMQKALTPCADDANFRQFDFWQGEWEVSDKSGTRVGSSHVDRALEGCLLIENWTSGLGGAGKSFNTFNPVTHKWQQFWVEDDGEVTSFEGGMIDGSMQLTGTQYHLNKQPTTVRMTFTALADGRVRQFGEETSDGGKTWQPRYDFYYARVKSASVAQTTTNP